MNHRDHLRRLPREYYQSDAIVHWTLTIRDRKRDWLSASFFYHFRELLTHTMFRYGLACPTFCVMPDHMHMIWMGLCPGSDQLNAMKYFRAACNESLSRIDCELQDQAYDHVLKAEERLDEQFRQACEYIARNPERAGLVPADGYAAYGFNGCLIPGYPGLRLVQDNYWDELNRILSFLRQRGLMRVS